MRFQLLRLQDFRNVELATLLIESERVFLLGNNGQGKSNLLEALGLATACRSFRTQNMAVLPRKGSGGFTLVYEIEHDHFGRSDLEIHGSSSGRKVQVDGEKIARLGDFIGRFPVVTMSSNDIQLLRGGPGDRRRFLDSTLSAIDPTYYQALRDYHKGLSERNRLLKKGGSPAEFDAFEAEIANRMVILNDRRGSLAVKLGKLVSHYYESMAEVDEGPCLVFRASSEAKTVADSIEQLRANRKRDAILGSTQKGAHRDDFTFGLQVGGAKEYASEGQQRALCVALRLAQLEIYRTVLSVVPVLLADDVLGELDRKRESGFWAACPEDIQIIATGTEPPKDRAKWIIHEVASGRLLGE